MLLQLDHLTFWGDKKTKELNKSQNGFIATLDLSYLRALNFSQSTMHIAAFSHACEEMTKKENTEVLLHGMQTACRVCKLFECNCKHLYQYFLEPYFPLMYVHNECAN